MSITPFSIPQITSPFKATITLPGSKSIALRQLALAALADSESIIRGVPPCDDSDAMLSCLQTLGVTVNAHEDVIIVHGPMDFGDNEVELDARMSGASMRLLIALAALRRGITRIDGHPALRARTNAPLLDTLAQHGCEIDSENGYLPLTIRGPFTPPPSFVIEGSLSSQYITALLIIASQSASSELQEINISGSLVSKPYIDITLNEMAKRGLDARWTSDQSLEVKRATVAGGSYAIEGDATAASYFSALATLHQGEVTLANLGADTVQGDYAFCDIMADLGATVSKGQSTTIRGPDQLRGLGELDLTKMPDAALTLIAMSPLLPSPTTIVGLESLHHKECDRLECPAAELRSIGVKVDTADECITITPKAPADMQPHTLNTYHDHRMAMAFSLIGSKSNILSVDDKAVVNKTYPNFWNDYASLLS